jgi:bacterioferritin
MQPIDSAVIAALNAVLRNELTAINQYFLHAKMFEDWGMLRIAEHEKAESIDEMKHADSLMERILFLEGLPNLQDLGKLHVGQDVKEILQCDLKLEMEALPALREGVALSEKVGDFVSRQVFREILVSEEEHIDWIETQLDLIGKTGVENYIQAQMGN